MLTQFSNQYDLTELFVRPINTDGGRARVSSQFFSEVAKEWDCSTMEVKEIGVVLKIGNTHFEVEESPDELNPEVIEIPEEMIQDGVGNSVERTEFLVLTPEGKEAISFMF